MTATSAAFTVAMESASTTRAPYDRWVFHTATVTPVSTMRATQTST